MTDERSSESKKRLLADIEKDSETLRRLLDLLAALSIDVQIVSIYEELQTPSVVKVSLDNVFNEVHSSRLLLELPRRLVGHRNTRDHG
jgi:hypothetical protein